MTHEEMVREVQKVFPEAICTGADPLVGFCIYWPIEMCPIIATGQHPKKAWQKAYKLIKGKNKKAQERLRQQLLGHEVKKKRYGAGMG